MTAGKAFPKKERLLRSKDFRQVYAKGRKVSVGGAAFCFTDNTLGYSRVGFSVGTRNFKMAADRNRIRRLFREAYRNNKAALKANTDIIVVVKRGFGRKTRYQDIERTFSELVQKAGLGCS
jgi:ribonuclease P protein component